MNKKQTTKFRQLAEAIAHPSEFKDAYKAFKRIWREMNHLQRGKVTAAWKSGMSSRDVAELITQ